MKENREAYVFLTSNKPTAPVSLLRFVYFTLVGQLLTAVPFLAIAWATGNMAIGTWGFIVGTHLIVGVPTVASVSWLIAKGSNWTNTGMAAAYSIGHGMPFYVLLSAVLLVIRFREGVPVWLVGALLLLVAVFRMRLFVRYARFMLRWLAPELGTDRDPAAA